MDIRSTENSLVTCASVMRTVSWLGFDSMVVVVVLGVLSKGWLLAEVEVRAISSSSVVSLKSERRREISVPIRQ